MSRMCARAPALLRLRASQVGPTMASCRLHPQGCPQCTSGTPLLEAQSMDASTFNRFRKNLRTHRRWVAVPSRHPSGPAAPFSSTLLVARAERTEAPAPPNAVAVPKGGLGATAEQQQYISELTREPEVLRDLREETRGMRGSQMQITVEQGAFLGLLVRLTGARKAIELGVFTGYSAICTALALPEDGVLVACEVDPRPMEVARAYFQRAGVAGKIDVRLAPALETLQSLVQDPKELNSFDFAFLDADKRMYGEYYELLLKLIRPEGLIVVDNVLWKGKVASKEMVDVKTESIRSFNKSMFLDKRIDFSLVSVGDGMALCQKRGT